MMCLFLQITSTLTLAAASASAGITVLIVRDLQSCSQIHYVQFETATAMAFISSFTCTALPSSLINFWSLATPAALSEYQQKLTLMLRV